jgi:hypothetical protein
LHAYWDSFYASRASDVPGDSSDFARWVQTRLDPSTTVAEFGFGTARDSLYFARLGHSVLGFDFAETAVVHAQTQADERGVDAEFTVLDLYDAPAVTAVAERLITVEAAVVYGRFLIHSLEESGRGNLFDLAAKALTRGGELLLEFRTGLDAGHKHVFGDDHFRVYLDPDAVVAEIEVRGGAVTYCEAGHGFAVYKSEDPHVARLAARFS